MEAIVFKRYGGPEVLEPAEVDAPTLGEHQVRIEVRAASINAADYRLMKADPIFTRVQTGLFAPTKTPILGADVAGVVVEVGRDLAEWVEAAAVFLDTGGGEEEERRESDAQSSRCHRRTGLRAARVSSSRLRRVWWGAVWTSSGFSPKP